MNQSLNVSNDRVQKVYDLQRSDYRANPYPDYQQRRDNLKKMECILRDHQEEIVDAISQDFGNRSAHETKILELFVSIDGLKDCRKNLKRWMKAERRHVSMWFAGAKNTVIPQPKGVVGIVVPWNYPLYLCMGPLANALAAGNRCMIKMAANSQNLCLLLARLVEEQFPAGTLAFIPGISAQEFTAQPYDHLVFTGSSEVGKTVMKTAAEHLTPVTLELGGKSPTIIGDDFDIDEAASRILQGKNYNAGQTCVAPDYVFVPEAKMEAFIAAATKVVSGFYQTIESKDYTSIIDSRAYNRLIHTLEDARSKGARLINLVGGSSPNEELRKIPLHIAVDIDDGMVLMQEEIFGPILPLKPYREIDEVLEFINNRPRPLALYLFSNNKKLQDHVVVNTQSGGVCFNEVMLHVGQHGLPFGGTGNSGMGHYHGYEGFLELSKLRPIFKQARMPGSKFLAPPYGKMADFMIKLMMR